MSNYFELQNNPVLTTPSALVAPKISTITYPGDDTAADTAGGQTITITGSGFETGASVFIDSVAVGVVSVVNNTTITFVSPALATGSYPLYVVNTDGGTAISVTGIQYSGVPTWTTAAGSLGTVVESLAIANTVAATGDAPISYSVFSGTLPTGVTLTGANGYISGTAPAAASPTTYNFTLRATDAEQQDTNRSFSYTINPDVVTWSSPADNTTYNANVGVAISNVTLSASAASGQGIVYTANSLPTGIVLSSGVISGTPTVAGNASTLLTATANVTNKSATRTINWSVVAGAPSSVEYLIVAGGGSGGGLKGGGGGAGGLLTSTASVTAGTVYTIIVGAGASVSQYQAGNQGSNSSAFSQTAVGGGGGASYIGSIQGVGGNGGSGGGGSCDSGRNGTAGKGVYPGSTYINATRQGYDGGFSTAREGGSGGGGAGATGSATDGFNGGNGGIGIQSSIGGTSTYYAGGGGGGGGATGYSSVGGQGGGGAGGGSAGTAGTANTGGGGGGIGNNPYLGFTAGAGGSGIVIIRYPDTFPNAASTTGSPTLTVTGGYKIYRFTSSGSITF